VFTYFSKIFEEIQVSLKSDKNNGYFSWRPMYIYDHISLFSLEWEMFQTKIVEKIKMHILCSITFFPRKSFHLWDKVEKHCGAGEATKTMWRFHITCWIRKAKNTLSELVIFIEFPLQQWLQVRALTLRYTSIASLPCWSIVLGLVVSPEDGSCLPP